jgi:predicted membrane-bound spermidine synthase
MKTNERDAATALRPFFVLFLVSGACSLVYEVVWIRLSMAVYGTTTPTISTVLSVFMAGLAIGSWGAGRVARRLASGAPSRFLRMYAAAELLIGLSALTVPAELDLGRRVLFSLGRETAWQDAGFLLASGTVVAITLLPFAIAMGATFPLAMAAIRGGDDEGSRRSFGFLYAANVLGAAGGVVLCAFVMIELLGFRGTLFVAAAGNAALALSAWALSRRGSSSPARKPAVEARDAAGGPVDRRALALLFTTGFVSMAMEVVWVRMLTPYLGPVVYSFALILAIYLAATFAGSWTWRFRSPEEGEGSVRFVWVLAGALSTLILAAADPRVPLAHGVTTGALRAIVGLVPFCAVIGWLTPRLVDLASQGDPRGRPRRGHRRRRPDAPRSPDRRRCRREWTKSRRMGRAWCRVRAGPPSTSSPRT